MAVAPSQQAIVFDKMLPFSVIWELITFWYNCLDVKSI